VVYGLAVAATSVTNYK